MTYKLFVEPDQPSLSAKLGAETISTQLAGGASRVRRDQIGAAAIVPLQWVLTTIQYSYFMAFYRACTDHGSLPFLIDLILDSELVQEYTARFVPDTLELAGVKGSAYIVSAQLEVIPLAESNVADLALVAAYEASLEPDPEL